MKLTLDIKDSNYNTFLEFIKTLNYVSVSKDWYDELTAEQQEDIQMGLDDLDNGRVFSDKEVRDEIRLKIENAKQL